MPPRRSKRQQKKSPAVDADDVPHSDLMPTDSTANQRCNTRPRRQRTTTSTTASNDSRSDIALHGDRDGDGGLAEDINNNYIIDDGVAAPDDINAAVINHGDEELGGNNHVIAADANVQNDINNPGIIVHGGEGIIDGQADVENNEEVDDDMRVLLGVIDAHGWFQFNTEFDPTATSSRPLICPHRNIGQFSK